MNEEGIPFLLTNRHVATNAKKTRLRSPLFPTNKETRAIFQLLKFEYPPETDDFREVENDFAIGIFKYPDLVRAKLNELSITPASLTHLETMLPPREAFKEPTPAEIVGCAGGFKAKLALATTHIAHSKDTIIGKFAALTEAIAANNKCLKVLEESLAEDKADLEALVKSRSDKGKDLDLQGRLLAIDEGEASARDNDEERCKSKQEEEIIAFEETEAVPFTSQEDDPLAKEELREAAVPAGFLWGHTESGDSGGGVFVDGELTALICEGDTKRRTIINGYRIVGDSYVPLQIHMPWIKTHIAVFRDGLVRHTPKKIREILESDDIPALLSDDAGAQGCCTVS